MFLWPLAEPQKSLLTHIALTKVKARGSLLAESRFITVVLFLQEVLERQQRKRSNVSKMQTLECKNVHFSSV